MSLTLSFASHSDLDNRHVLLPNDHPIHPCWVPMEPSSPSQLDLEPNRPPPGVAIFLQGCVLCRRHGTTGRSPTVPGSGRSHHDSDHHFHYIHKLRKFLPRFLNPQSRGFMSSTRIVFHTASRGSDSSLDCRRVLRSAPPNKLDPTGSDFVGRTALHVSITFGCCLCDFVYQVSNLI